MNQLIMHVNYGEPRFAQYGSNTVDSICKMATEIGFDGIEFRASVPSDKKDMEFSDYINQIAEAKKKYDVSRIMFGVGIPQAANPQKEERQKSIDGACEILKLVNDKCDATICNCFGQWIRSPHATAPQNAFEYHGSGAATEEQMKLTVDSFQQFGEVAEKLGVKLAIETHMNYIHDLPEVSRKLVDLIGSPNVGLNMDFGNTVEFSQYPGLEETIDLYGDKIYYVHIKNSIKVPGATRNVPVALSEGMINHRAYFKKLKEIGYEGPIGLEATRPGDRLMFAKQDFAYAKSLI